MSRLRIAVIILAGILLSLLAGCITVKVSLFEEPGPLEEQTVSGFGRDKVLLLDISGVILERPHRLWGGLTGVASPARIKEELEKAGRDDRIKALVVLINSPGGTVTGADVVLHELQKFKQDRRVPLVVCLQGLATSGGYYVAQAGDVIMAYPTCLTGSIGVLAMKLNVQKLLDKVGVDPETVKTGPWKDFWSPFRPSSPEEKAMMQAVIDNYYQGFLEVVAQGRRMDLNQVRQAADGRLFTARQALKMKLVDKLGYPDDAVALAQSLAGLERATVVRYRRPGSHRPTIYSLGAMLSDLDMAAPQFLYLWAAGESLTGAF